MFSRLFPPTGRDTQWTLGPGQLGQTTAGELGSGREERWLVDQQSQENEAGIVGIGRWRNR